MIYIYGKGDQLSVVYQPEYLSEEAKARVSLIVEELPKKDVPENHYAVLNLDDDNKLFWAYIKIIASEE